MKKIVISYGLIGGLIVGGMMFLTVPLYNNGTLNISNGQWLGYSTMLIALSMVFFGVRNFRDKINGGTISFGKAFKIGILISIITALVYAISWEICHLTIASDFMEKYTEQAMLQLKSSGLSELELQAKEKEMAAFTEMYKNPAIRFGLTLMEILPVGILVTLISAFVLKKKG